MTYGDKTVAYLDINFMHKGLPPMELNAKWDAPKWAEPKADVANIENDVKAMVARLNVCSNEYKARQYDHEVKGLSVIKPFVGKERDVVSDATINMVKPLSTEGFILSSGLLPRYSDIDTYHMMSSTIDLTVRRIIAVGGKLGHIAGLDNFCWPDPVKSEKTPDGEYKLAQLVRANKALYDYTKAFQVPLISGKDSMKNDSTIGDKKISIPPTVLFSTIAKMDDVTKAVTLDFKSAGDILYVIGDTKDEMGGSEFYAMLENTIGNDVPKVDAEKALEIYRAVSAVTDQELAKSLGTPAIGGLAIALAKAAIAGRLGVDIDLSKIPMDGKLSVNKQLFSESNSRFIMTVSPENVEKVDALLSGIPFAKVGTVTEANIMNIQSGEESASIAIDELVAGYKDTLDGI
jgi:phosphoribosylformylglycinamidine synthase